MSASRQYELVYLITPEASDQEVADLHTQIEQIIQRFGSTNTVLDKTENWGRRKLAYEIGHHREAIYVVETISSTSGDVMKEIDRRLRVTDQVIRHLVVRVDEEKKVVERTRSKRQAESERRRVKRGLPPQRQPGEGHPREDDDDGYSDLDAGSDAAV